MLRLNRVVCLVKLDFDVVKADKLKTLVKAAGVDVEPYWYGLFAKLLASKKITDLISGVGAVAAPAAAAPAAAAKQEAPKEEAKKKKKTTTDEGDGDMGFGLFD